MFTEIQRLKDSQERTGGGTGNALEKEVEILRKKLYETQDTLAASTRFVKIFFVIHVIYIYSVPKKFDL